MKKMIKLIILALLCTLILEMPVAAGKYECGYNGCTKNILECNNGTRYCDTHAPVYAKEKGYTTCAVYGCFACIEEDSKYCGEHTCKYRKCVRKSKESFGYCKEHACNKEGCAFPSGYTSGSKKGYCIMHGSRLESSESSSKSTSTKKSTSVNSKSTSTRKSTSVNSKSTSAKKNTSKKSTSTTKKKYTNPYENYDKGYEDVYYNDDYDWDRYWSDSDYADGVDDALADLEDEGEDW